MKRWQAILLNIGLAAAGWATKTYVPPQFQDITYTAIGITSAGVIKKASDSNPDGTPATIAFQKEVKK